MLDDFEGIKSLLSEVPVLSGLGEKDLEELTGHFSLLQLEAGQELYQAGEPTDGLHVLARGKLRLSSPEHQAPEQLLERGELAGEEALVNQPARQFQAVALTACELWFMENSQVQEYLMSKPIVQRTHKVLIQSRQLTQRIPMPWLQEGERVFLMTRKHPMFLFFQSLWPILSFAIVMVLATRYGAASPTAVFITLLVAFAICALWLAWNIHNWANDFYLITTKRMVWVERISGFYDSRQEAPLGTLISVGIQTTQLGAIFGYSDVVVRTYIGDIRFNRVADAKIIGKLVEVYWSKSKAVDLDLEAKEIRSALRKKFGKDGEVPDQKGLLEAESQAGVDMPIRETSFFEWLFSDFLKVRYEVGGTTTYRKHWFVLLRKSFLPSVGLLLSIILVVAVVTRNFTFLDYGLALTLGVLLLIALIFWLVYIYSDWRNDIFQLTPNQVIDIDRKPFGKESRRSAPLDNILSIEYERRGFIPMLFNFGTVFITIGNTQLTFNDVYQPSQVQQDIFTRMGAFNEEKQQRQIDEERERVAQWFRVYHDETHQEDPTKKLRTEKD
ncbi:MAG: cyclic nucleotide-binding domain-containing protein [Anaerolineaceae bacterium]